MLETAFPAAVVFITFIAWYNILIKLASLPLLLQYADIDMVSGSCVSVSITLLHIVNN